MESDRKAYCTRQGSIIQAKTWLLNASQKRKLELLERQRQMAAERFGIEGDVPEVALRLLNKYDYAEAQAWSN